MRIANTLILTVLVIAGIVCLQKFYQREKASGRDCFFR